ncbi:MAG: FadR/GntR family transcriptional regulator [Spirochaetota bacterium]
MSNLRKRPNKGNKSSELFKAEKRESAVDRVINSIKEALIKGKIHPGDRLPPETELSRGLAVSRGSVREAMKTLSAFGIVEIRQGNGTYISRSDEHVIFEPLLFSLVLNKENLKEITELRELLEIEIVKLVCCNAEEQDLREIEQTVRAMESIIEKNDDNQLDRLPQVDLAFHRALGRATKNRLVEKIYYFVMDFFTPSIEMTHKKQQKGRKALRDHKNIYGALSEHNLEKAIKAVENSIQSWKSLSFQQEREK